jgi:Brp/Blh family beta-carotene 15,15'-monooxygenase
MYDVPPQVDYALFSILLTVVGIPHGAVDHLVEAKSQLGARRPFSLHRFLGLYVLQMTVYAALWLVFPAVSLLLFLLLSAWHFGESDTEPAPNHILWHAFKGCLGAWVLCFILLREPAFTADVIHRIARGNPYADTAWLWVWQHHIVVLIALGLCAVGLYSAGRLLEPVAHACRRWLPWCAVMGVVYFLPLLPAFALYFGGWHAVNTFRHMHHYLGPEATPWWLWRRALPFTLLSTAVLLLTAVVWWRAFSDVDPMPVVFIFIAIITLPHLLVMSRMFKSLPRDVAAR